MPEPVAEKTELQLTLSLAEYNLAHGKIEGAIRAVIAALRLIETESDSYRLNAQGLSRDEVRRFQSQDNTVPALGRDRLIP